jgi:surfeit locus 1 family protein
MTPVRARVGVWVAALSMLMLTLSLGWWQCRRADQKQAMQDALAQRQTELPWTSADWPCAGQDASVLPVYRPVHLRGRWVSARTVWLDNRPMDGRSGFDVVTPLRLHAPGSACDGQLLLVQRGWVPRHQQDRLTVPDLHTPEGEVVLTGRVQAEVSRAYQLGTEALIQQGDASAPVVRQNADAVFWRTWLGQSPLPGAALQLQAEEVQHVPVDSPMLRHWPAPDLGKGKHLAYAVQWFALAALIAGLTIWFQIIRPRRTAAHVHH